MVVDSFAIGADADTVHAFREVPEDLSKLFRAEIFFMAADKQARVCLLPLYDKEGKAWWVLGNREVSTPTLFRRPPRFLRAINWLSFLEKEREVVFRKQVIEQLQSLSRREHSQIERCCICAEAAVRQTGTVFQKGARLLAASSRNSRFCGSNIRITPFLVGP